LADEDINLRGERAPGSVAPGDLSALLGELARAPPAELGGAWDRWLVPGAVVGAFELVREIGRGGFGVVWEARDLRRGGAVAFKAVRAGGAASAREERLLREAEVAARLAHPNVVALHEVGRTEQGPYLVLELLRGRTLADRLAAGPIGAPEALAIGVEVAKAVAYAHARGVVHRDLKPGNVFLCDGGAVKVLDFGLAHAFGHRRIGGGTPAYMAPEQWRGAPEDERTDVFALGVLLFRMLAGELPFPGDSGSAAPGAGPAPALEVPGAPALGPLVGRMLEGDPVERPRDGEAVLAALEGAAAELARHPGAAAPARILRPAGSGRARAPVDVRAEEYAQRGRQFLRQTRKASLRFARDMFARAVAVDPGYALAHAGQAEAIALVRMYYAADEADLAVADRASARAVELDPALAEAHTARGITLFLLGRRDEARRALERAAELDPGLAEASYYGGRVAFQEGRMEDAVRLFRAANRARENHDAAFFAAQAVEAAGRHAEARDAYAQALAVVERHMDLNPDDPRAATMRAVSLCRVGRREEGLRWAREALAMDPLDAGVRYNVACIHAIEGAADEALSYLAEAIRAGFGNRQWFERDPDLDSLRSDPRFAALLSGM
jgi:tetratricopeptide (TPR) repeat protein